LYLRAQREPNSLQEDNMTADTYEARQEAREARSRALAAYLDALDVVWLKVRELPRCSTTEAQYDVECEAAKVEYARTLAEIRLLTS
jgi:uncharacterized membrane protein